LRDPAALAALGVARGSEVRRGSMMAPGPGIVQTGAVALVTGASRGLGFALARELVASGSRVALVARDPAALERARGRLCAAGPADAAERIVVVAADVGVRDQARAAIETVLARFGRLDLLLNNAGTIDFGSAAETPDEVYAAALRVHFWGPLTLMRAALPAMRRQGGGGIVNVAAIEGLVGVPRLAATAASKFALVGLTESVRAEWAADGVRVTLICPGFIRPEPGPGAAGPPAPIPGARLARLPGVSIGEAAAARKILAAARRGRARLVLTPAARALVVWHALAPGSLGRAMAALERRLWRRTAGAANTTAAL
jgi:NAD(P)-dependent dehydrogenase (short-subunit alcohol dehydrogenase family)